VWREAPGSEQGLGVFYRVGGGPRDRSRFQMVMDTGLNYRGPLPGRDEDIAGLGLAYAKHSDDLATDHEFVIEATYSIQIAPWWVIQPDLQYISRPGGGTTPDAWAAGLRAVFSF
jgi:porin